MATLKGIQKLIKALEHLQAAAEEARENLDQKREWWESKSEKWQQSATGQEWDEHLNTVESTLDDIENIDVPEL